MNGWDGVLKNPQTIIKLCYVYNMQSNVIEIP